MDKAGMTEKLLIDMGDRIAKKRKQYHLTQEELAEKINSSKQMISNAENGKTALRPESILRLCAALEISTDYLLSGRINDIDIAILQSKINRLKPEQFQCLENIINEFVSFCAPDVI